jgi:glc operon protein GlcG
VRAAFIDPFRKSKFDEGLLQGLTALESELRNAKAAGKVPQAERVDGASAGFDRPLQLSENAASPAVPAAGKDHESAGGLGQEKALVIRNQVRLTLEGARTIVAGATKQAESMNLKVNIAVVDDGGHLLSFDRMNGARPASGYTAMTKATTAATFRQPSGPIPVGTASPDPLLNLSLQIAAQASGGKLTTLYGGIPVVVDGQVIGAVGVGGGSGEQDALVARAGVQAFLDALDNQSPR